VVPRGGHSSVFSRAFLGMAAVILAGILMAGDPAQGAKAKVLHFGLSPTSLLDRFQALADGLSKELGQKVELVQVRDVDEFAMGLATGSLDIVCLGPVQYVKIQQFTRIEPLVNEIGEEGTTSYHALLISAADGPITNVEAAKGKVLAFSRRDSTSATLVPMMHFVRDLKVTPANFASQVIFNPDHFEVARGVLDGRYSLGATNEYDLHRFCKIRQVECSRFRVLWTSPPIPTGPYCVRKELAPELKLSIKKAFLALNQRPEIMVGIQLRGFAGVSDADYQIIRDALKYMNY